MHEARVYDQRRLCTMCEETGVWGSRDVCLLGGWCLCCGRQGRSFWRKQEKHRLGKIYGRYSEYHVKERKDPEGQRQGEMY